MVRQGLSQCHLSRRGGGFAELHKRWSTARNARTPRRGCTFRRHVPCRNWRGAMLWN